MDSPRILTSENTPRCSSGIKLDYAVMREYIKCRHVDEADKIYFKGWSLNGRVESIISL